MTIKMRYEKYSKRFWAVYDGDDIICVTVYLKGAKEVIRRLELNELERKAAKFGRLAICVLLDKSLTSDETLKKLMALAKGKKRRGA
jgi:hypothetical protein